MKSVVSQEGKFSTEKEPAPAQNWGNISICFYEFEQKSLSRFILSFFCRPLPQLHTLDMIFAECKQLLDFPIMSKSSLGKWWRKLGYCYRGVKCKCISNLIFILCTKSATLLKTSFWYTATFFKISKNTYFAEHPPRVASNDMIIATASHKLHSDNHFLWKLFLPHSTNVDGPGNYSKTMVQINYWPTTSI